MNIDNYKLIATLIDATKEEKVWPKLEDGAVYVNKASDVIEEISKDKVKALAKDCGRYYSSDGLPVTLFYKPFHKKQITEAVVKVFINFNDMLSWLDRNNVIIYKINTRNDNGMYQLRYFDIKLNFFSYWYDRFAKFILKIKHRPKK